MTLPRLRRLSQTLFLGLFLGLLRKTEFRGSFQRGEFEFRLPHPVRAFLETNPLTVNQSALKETERLDGCYVITPDFAPWPTVPPGIPSAAIRKRNADLFIGRNAAVTEAKEVIRAYIASISWADWNLGRVVAEVDRLGLRQNTIMVFTVDHGYQLGEKGKWSKAGSLFEMGTRVPLLIVAPGAKSNGQACLRVVQSLDLYSTLAELCGLPLPAGNEGRSLVPLLHDPKARWDQPAYSVWSEDGRTLHGVMVRSAQWRYVEFGPDGANGAMLFDIYADPYEMKNLTEDPKRAKVRAQLSPLVRAYAAKFGKARV